MVAFRTIYKGEMMEVNGSLVNAKGIKHIKCREPKMTLEHKIEITNENHEMYGMMGFHTMSRPSDTQVLVYLPLTNNRGFEFAIDFKEITRI